MKLGNFERKLALARYSGSVEACAWRGGGRQRRNRAITRLSVISAK